jgi:hypothetical protein
MRVLRRRMSAHSFCSANVAPTHCHMLAQALLWQSASVQGVLP